MKFKAVLSVLGDLFLLLAGLLLLPLGVSLVTAFSTADSAIESAVRWALVDTLLTSLGTGILLVHLFPRKLVEGVGIREGCAIVTLGWLSLAFFAALPFYWPRICPTLIDAYFETMSGLTTTGASVIADLDDLPKSILLWRSLLQWIGGLGIVVLSVAVLHLLGMGGYQIFRAETPGPTTDKWTPRIAETARLLWRVYTGLTLAAFVLLWIGGMSLFDALCHAMSTLSTGGYSTKNASIGYYRSAYFETIVTLFMFLGGCNFLLHYQIVIKRNWRAVWANAEWRAFLGVILIASVIIMLFLHSHPQPETLKAPSDADHVYHTWSGAFRYAVFQVVSILTTTGFATADFERWPFACQAILVLLMFLGGCAGSTSGGMKIIRLILLAKAVLRELYRLVHPHQIFQIKLSGETVPSPVIETILVFFVAYLFLCAFFTVTMTLLGVDLLTSFTSVVSCLGNVGPGLGSVGPYENYAQLPQLGKCVLSLCMLLGRLEIYTVAVLCLPACWKKY